MARITLTLLIALTIAVSSFGQTITYEDFKEVIPFLQREDFKSAYEKTERLLKTTDNDNSDLRGILTYMNIFSAAGMVTLDQMSYKKFEKVSKKFLGQYLVMSAHICVDSSSMAYNAIQFQTNESGKLEGMSVIVNNKKTSILCFEYFEYADKINPSEMIDKNVRCGGTLKSIEINPNKSKIWVAKLRISNAFARLMTPL
jgi:hypothetical protein